VGVGGFARIRSKIGQLARKTHRGLLMGRFQKQFRGRMKYPG
jgi:hypothetical protein